MYTLLYFTKSVMIWSFQGFNYNHLANYSTVVILTINTNKNL